MRVIIPTYREPLSVIMATMEAVLEAALPSDTVRTVYLCDDGNDPNKKAYIASLGRADVVYVSGRVRKPNEVNGKSANLNNCLKNVIYKNTPLNGKGEIDFTLISNRELIVVFDSDMRAGHDFFLKVGGEGGGGGGEKLGAMRATGQGGLHSWQNYDTMR